MRHLPHLPFPCFCFAVFVLCIPMSYEFRVHDSAALPVHHTLPATTRPAPILERVKADARLVALQFGQHPAPARLAFEHARRRSHSHTSFRPAHADSASASDSVQVQ